VRYFDSHTHLNFSVFEDDCTETILRAQKLGVFLVNVGTQKDTSQRAVELANEYDDVYATVGLHPVHTAKSYHSEEELGGDKGFTSRGEDFDYEFYKNLADDNKVVAIGECGLDYFRSKVSDLEFKDRQKKVFLSHIKLACEVNKPLMIHCREAYDDLIRVLEENNKFLGKNPGIIHFFSGTPENTLRLLEIGFCFTFGGVVTFTRDYDEVIRMIPEDKILSETDAPYVTPVPYRGERNEPAYVVEVVRKLAEIRGIGEEKMTEALFANACRVFGVENR
jgi:TatD DNase family protein